MNNTDNYLNIGETTEEITISQDEYNKLHALIQQQVAEIDVLEFRIKSLLDC